MEQLLNGSTKLESTESKKRVTTVVVLSYILSSIVYSDHYFLKMSRRLADSYNTGIRERLSRTDGDPRLTSISKKLKSKNVKAATIVSRCENLDIDGDDVIHMNDLHGVLNQTLGHGTISQREMLALADTIGEGKQRGSIEYKKLIDVLEGEPDRGERWFDGEEEEPVDRRWATKRGSVGEWLKNAACPAEVQNFKTFIGCLEEFERMSGMKCVPSADGFTVPLGPDLRASINFYMT